MLFSKLSLGVLTLAVASSLPVSALADDQPTMTSETAVADKPVEPPLSERLLLTYYGYWRGAALNDFSNSLQPTLQGDPDPTSPQSIETSITAGYKFDKKTSLAAVIHFNHFIFGNPVGSGQDLTMYDPSLRLNRAGIIDVGGFKLNTALTYSFPVTGNEYISRQSYVGTLTSIWSASYDIPKTRLNLSLFSYLAAYIPSAGTPGDSRTYRIVLAPYGSYSITDSFQLTVWFDLLDARRHGGSHFFGGLADNVGDLDIEPGFNWDINKYVSINPFLNIYPKNPTLASTSLQVAISARAF